MQLPFKSALGALSLMSAIGCTQVPPPSAVAVPLPEQEIELPPAPPRPLTVGIYNCIDTTGQRRPTQLAQELSSAVPLDCTPYLVEAVRALRPGYVFLVERQHVDVLLRERQLATLALNTAAGASNGRIGDAAAHRLSVLRVAEILLVGQVAAYDRTTHQASAGLAIGGIGGSATYVTDLITFSLRAVAVQTGEILGQSTVTKSVTSLLVGGHYAKIFSTSIVEAELGAAANEPIGLALRAAVRGALTRLVKQGIDADWWEE